MLDTYDFKEIDEKLVKITYDETENLVRTLADISPKAVVYHNEARFRLKKYLEKKRSFKLFQFRISLFLKSKFTILN